MKLHTKGNTWKYTLDIYKLRICFYRVKQKYHSTKKNSIVGIGWGSRILIR